MFFLKPHFFGKSEISFSFDWDHIYLVYSLDLIDDILYSTDGKYVISWNLCTFQMMIKTQVFNDDHVEELAVVDNQSCETLKVAHEIPLIVTRSSSDVKVCKRTLRTLK